VTLPPSLRYSVTTMMRRDVPVNVVAWGAALVMVACSAAGDGATDDDDASSEAGSGAGGPGSSNVSVGTGGSGPKVGVPQTCQEAVEQHSYLGCEYWPTVTSNAGLYKGFEFAVVAANPTKSEAVVTVERGGQQLAQNSLAPGALTTIKLPWVNALKQDDPNGDGSGLQSVLVTGGAYRVTSSVPITLYQFNPLDFKLGSTPPDCANALELGGCYSFSNDASLLLPTSALRGDYFVMSYPTFHIGFGDIFNPQPQWSDNPGFVAITATQDNTAVQVASTAHVRPGNGVAAISAGGQGSYTLNAGDVLMLSTAAAPATATHQPGKPCEIDNQGLAQITKCPTAPEYDLTGSRIVADKPISVIGGHDCTFVPYNRFACDHLEESMFPVATLGQDLFVTAPQAVAAIESGVSTPDNTYVRVLSAIDNNNITFEPAVNGPVTLNAGQWIEFGPVKQDFRVLADNKIMVAQFMVGENFSGESAGAGDPAQTIAIPTEQYRAAYTFLAPDTYTYNYVNVVAPSGAVITIDGQTIPATSFSAIGGTGYSVARHRVEGGSHSMTGDANFGIVAYGYGSYTSYMLPAGLNLETVIIDPK
jgi:hypothetical protein